MANDIQRLAVEYRDWRSATQQMQMKLNYSEKHIRVFLLYLAKGGYYQLGRSEGPAECTTMMYLHDNLTRLHSEMQRRSWRNSWEI